MSETVGGIVCDTSGQPVDSSPVRAGDDMLYPSVPPEPQFLDAHKGQGDDGASPETEGEAASLGDIINLPQPEKIIEEAPTGQATPPPSALNMQLVKKMLDKKGDTYPDKRIADLLAYAWNTHHPVERVVPPMLIPFITDSPASWYAEHKQRINQILAASRNQRSPDHYELEEINEATKLYETDINAAFLRNAIRINKTSWKNEDGVRVELSARMILLEAAEAASLQT